MIGCRKKEEVQNPVEFDLKIPPGFPEVNLNFSDRLKCGGSLGGFSSTNYRFVYNRLDRVNTDPRRQRLTKKLFRQGKIKTAIV